MNQCQCSSNKLGVHCYQCADEELELQNRVPKMAKKTMSKKKEAGDNIINYLPEEIILNVEEECCECDGDGQIIVRPAVSAPYLEECTWCDGKGVAK